MANTKIDLEHPYRELWRFGYLVINSENRKNVILYNSHRSRSTVSYARYLMSVKLGRFLTDQEQVDHEDEDKTNDDISNLQILTPGQNTIKNSLYRIGSTNLVTLGCPNCMTRFERRRGNTQLVPSMFGKITCCSRKCAGKISSLPEDLREIVSIEQVFGEYQQVPPVSTKGLL